MTPSDSVVQVESVGKGFGVWSHVLMCPVSRLEIWVLEITSQSSSPDSLEDFSATSYAVRYGEKTCHLPWAGRFCDVPIEETLAANGARLDIRLVEPGCDAALAELMLALIRKAYWRGRRFLLADWTVRSFHRLQFGGQELPLAWKSNLCVLRGQVDFSQVESVLVFLRTLGGDGSFDIATS